MLRSQLGLVKEALTALGRWMLLRLRKGVVIFSQTGVADQQRLSRLCCQTKAIIRLYLTIWHFYDRHVC